MPRRGCPTWIRTPTVGVVALCCAACDSDAGDVFLHGSGGAAGADGGGATAGASPDGSAGAGASSGGGAGAGNAGGGAGAGNAGGGAGAGNAGSGGQPGCTPKDCADFSGVECGTVDDGCNGTIDLHAECSVPACPPGQTCLSDQTCGAPTELTIANVVCDHEVWGVELVEGLSHISCSYDVLGPPAPFNLTCESGGTVLPCDCGSLPQVGPCDASQRITPVAGWLGGSTNDAAGMGKSVYSVLVTATNATSSDSHLFEFPIVPDNGVDDPLTVDPIDCEGDTDGSITVPTLGSRTCKFLTKDPDSDVNWSISQTTGTAGQVNPVGGLSGPPANEWTITVRSTDPTDAGKTSVWTLDVEGMLQTLTVTFQ